MFSRQLDHLVRAAAVVGMVVIAGFPAVADEVAPSHVFQVVANISAELDQVHAIGGTQPKPDSGGQPLTERRPRHVLQKAREVLLKVQSLRNMNGLASSPVPASPVREVLPAEVKKLVNRILADVIELRSKIAVAEQSPQVPLVLGKTLTDVYGDLELVDWSLVGFSIPRILPSDVFQVATTILRELEKVWKVRGVEGRLKPKFKSKRKKPRDVYGHAFVLLETLKAKVEAAPEFAIPGGIVMPNKRKALIRPAHVMDLLNNILAEIDAIKLKLGIKSPIRLVKRRPYMTPSHVFDTVDAALKAEDDL